MEASNTARTDAVRRSGRSRKTIERFAPSAADDLVLSTSVLNAEPAAFVAGARRQRKRQIPTQTSQYAPKRRKTSTSATQATSDPDADFVEEETSPATSSGTTFASLKSAQVDGGSQKATSSRKKASPRKPRSTPAVQKAAQAIPTSPPRPAPHGVPLVHAEGRQALCESLPYYHAYQSGVYATRGLAYGFLLSNDCTGKVYIDDEIVIARAGGHCGLNDDGVMEQITDHTSDNPGIVAFRRNKELKVPVVCIAGRQNTRFPVELPHQYCVMAHFQVTDTWAEMNRGKLCFMHRLEKIDRTSKSWWARKDSPDRPMPPAFPSPAFRQTCVNCAHQSTQIYREGWMCLNENCDEFFLLNGAAPSDQLEYNTAFIEERTPWPASAMPPWPLMPELPNASAFAWKGIVCPKCGRCNSRRHWHAWICDTEGCDFVHQLPQPILSAKMLLEGNEIFYDGHALPLDMVKLPVTMRAPEFIGGWRVHTYDLCPGNSIAHYHASEGVNRVPDGSNDLLEALQQQNPMGLQRFPMKMKTGQGEVLAKHFAINYGMPYKYVVATESKSFRDAPPAILSALHRMDWAAKHSVIDGTLVKFNELLAVGYFEKNAMNWHDDGEKALMPTVASLSLGGRAKMSFRMKERYFKGFTKSDKYNSKEPVLDGAALVEERRALNELHNELSSAEFEAKRKQMYKANARAVARKAQSILDLELAHGDIVVMHGFEMQKYFEHKVEPSCKLRFALTCRHIKSEQVDEEHHALAEYDDAPADMDFVGTSGGYF